MSVYVGIGGWVFPEWRDNFYPKGLSQKRELEYASSKLTAIEINGTYYGSQKPESFRKWHDETPDGFVFALKGPRFATNRRVLAEAGDSIQRFLDSGITELKDKLGPLNWQFMATKKFDAADFEAFLKLLPKKQDGRALRHAVEVRHDSFKDKAFVQMCRDHGVAVIFAADSEFPVIGDVTADFVYARLMGTQAQEKLGYPKAMLSTWAARAKDWAGGADARKFAVGPAAPKKKRDVFLFVISGAKEKNPAAAQGIIAALYDLARAIDGDLAAIVDLMNRAFRGAKGWATEDGYLVGDRIRLEDLRAEIAAKPDMLLVWREDGRLLGCVSLEDVGRGVWFLGMLTVEPDIQDQQLGRRLLEACEARVRTAGGVRICMTVIWLREALIAWYARRGYLPTGEIKPFPYGDDRWGTPTRDDLHFVVLKKPLSAL